MSQTWIVQIPSNEPDAAPILIHVSRKGKADHGLDIDLLATDGDVAYRSKLRERNLKKLRAKTYDGSDEDWSTILQHYLVTKQTSNLSSSTLDNLEVGCSTSGKDPNITLTISFRSRIEDITQRIGAIELSQSSDTDDVDLFGWANQVVAQRDGLEKDMVEAQANLQTAEQTIESLQSQLAELTKTKDDHENELLSKFVLLMNEKKAKLRDMQRILSISTTDKKKLDELEKELDSGKKSSSKRGKKRKAPTTKQVPGDESESDGFDQMDIDEQIKADKDVSSDSSRQTTPTQSDTEEEDVLDQHTATKAASSSKTVSSSKNTRVSASNATDKGLPPPRELPFTRKSESEDKKNQQESKSHNDDSEETASEDDEL